MDALNVTGWWAVCALAACGAIGCSSQGSGGPGGKLLADPPGDGGLRPFVPPDPTRLGAGQMLLTASGEALAQQGYNFPDLPSNGVFADGWEVRFAHFIAIFDQVTLSGNPDRVPTDQSQTDAPVAEAVGPWIIDLSKPTAADVMGKEQGETATPFATITSQNLAGNQSFATDGTKYAVGFSAIAASPSLSPIDVNLDDEGRQIYAEMLANGCSVVYDGTATFKADPAQCTTQDPEFARFPPVVHFHLCFKSPTTYVNCDNQDVSGIPFGDEPHPRGVVFPTNTYVTGEITFHTDHPFWESVLHDTPAHFDQFAARAAGQATDGGAPPTVTLDDVSGVDYLAYTDALGNPVLWRSCVKDSQGMPYGAGTGRMSFDAQSVPKAPPGPERTAAGLRDYYDYATYNQSTQGHWNGTDGLCFVRRNYPSPR
jgi:hypothetical protein